MPAAFQCHRNLGHAPIAATPHLDDGVDEIAPDRRRPESVSLFHRRAPAEDAEPRRSLQSEAEQGLREFVELAALAIGDREPQHDLVGFDLFRRGRLPSRRGIR